MDVPLQMSFKHIEKTPALDQLVREKAAKLDKMSNSLTSCRVHVEREHAGKTAGSHYHLRIELHAAPDQDLIVEHRSGEGGANDELSTLLIQAFRTAQRRLRDHEEQLHGEVKSHPEQEVGAVVSEIFEDEDYGFAETATGETIYFHRNSVIHDHWDRLQKGSGVRLVITEGIKGPQQLLENLTL